MKKSISLCTAFLALSIFNPTVNADPSDDKDDGIFSLINDLNEKADQLETKVDHLAASIPEQEPVYDYRNYVAAPTVTSRTYNFYDTKSSIEQGCRTETHQINRIPNPDGSRTILIERKRFNNTTGFICNLRNYNYLATPEAFIFNGYQQSNYQLSHNSPFTNRKSNMKVGDSWAHASGTVKTGSYNTHTLRETTFTAVEDVSTPYQNYTACLKMHIKQRSVAAAAYDAIEWYCQDVGLVKRMLVFNDGKRSLRIKLTGIN